MGDRLLQMFAHQVIEKMSQAVDLYHRLILVIAPAGKGKTRVLRCVHAVTGAPLINVNLELSRRMLDLTERQRAVRLPQLLSELVRAFKSDVVLLDNTEILFAVALRQDPLRLLQGLSRTRTTVAAWNGALRDGNLTYATPEHPEYRRYPLQDFLYVDLDRRSPCDGS
ncbi:MAG: BREX-3 system P-loop-containing protein BrxF [Bacillota bacterium]